MKSLIFVSWLAVAALAGPTAARAQLHATGPIVNGHHHFNASNIDEHMRFWVDTLGGTRGTFANGTPIVLFPNALIFMRDRAPAGPMVGSSVDHVAFSVQNLRATVDRVVAAGYDMVTETAAPPGVQVVNDIGVVAGSGPVSGIAYAMGPDGIKVEILEMRAQERAIVSHHIHFFGPDAAAMRAWYMDVFGAAERPGNLNGIIGADLPGLGLNFSRAAAATAGTAGRVLDHIGFEVENLKAFTERLEARGMKLDVPYREVEALGIAIAFVTDPWGTSIELTEGLDKVGKEQGR
jgi:catechol 2,3-dioxygenase-like lactoylglutathione lyase family enzyme